MDKKLYRHITLSNGLKCVLICDTVAMRQRKLDGNYEESDEESEDDGDGEDDNDSDSNNNSNNDSNNNSKGLRKAATALLVNVGSYYDPPRLQGLVHFLKHMLFLGTADFPRKNAYDAFLSQ